jgi:prevent-host-death family protein
MTTTSKAKSTVGVYEAKTRLSELLDRVAKGETITITRHGVPVAVLAPTPESRALSVEQAVEDLKRLRKGRSLGGLTIRELIEEGRRY